jgi:conserved oligomeric Golgi complex subunit 5
MGWQAPKYVHWVEEHSEEAFTLVEGRVMHWEKMSETEGRELAVEHVTLARSVLANAIANTNSNGWPVLLVPVLGNIQ